MIKKKYIFYFLDLLKIMYKLFYENDPQISWTTVCEEAVAFK